MTDNRTLQQFVDDTVAQLMTEYEASNRPPTPTPDEEIAARLSRARFRETIGEQALLHGVRPAAIKHVVRDAETVFELKDGALVARNGATDPGDPLAPLTAACWLQQLAKSEPYLFAPEGQAH